MRKRLIIHIGTHKTGTTSIQHFFAGNREANFTKYSIYYPRTDRDPEPHRPRHYFLTASVIQHVVRVADCPGVPSPAALVRELTEEIKESGAQQAFVSEESLSLPFPQIASAYSEFAEYFDVKVLVFLRRQDLFVEALHNQFIRDRGERRTLSDFVAGPRTQARMDYRQVLRAWESAFGRDAIIVIPFEKSVRNHGLLNTVFGALGIPAEQPLPDPAFNVSPGREAAELLRWLNSTRARKRNEAVMRVLEELGLGGGTTRVLGKEQRQKLLAGYADGNAEIAKRYLGRADGILFQDQIEEEADDEDDWRMSEAEMIDRLARICCHMSVLLDKPRTREIPTR